MLNHNLCKNIGPLQNIFVALSKVGVPLISILTGYLNGNKTKTIEDDYMNDKWKRYIDIIIVYIVLDTLCYLSMILFYDNSYNIKKIFFITPLINSMITGLKNINTNYKERDYQVSK